MSTLTPGLVSVTFRQLSPEQIVELAAANGLRAIEWGGDVHCPHGYPNAARRVAALTSAAGLRTYAYGSYYRVGGAPNSPRFEDVLATARELGAPSIRVWAGTVGSAVATAEDRERVTADLASICGQAEREGLRIALEYHNGTLTDTPESTVALLRSVSAGNLASYWQPRHGLSVEANLAEIAALGPWLGDVHVFHWWPTAETRHPLDEGMERWRAYFAVLQADGRPRVAALEFVLGDRPAQLVADAAALLAGIASPP